MYKILACLVVLTVLHVASAQNAEEKLLCMDKCTSGPTSQLVSCIRSCADAAVLSDARMRLATLLADSNTRARQTAAKDVANKLAERARCMEACKVNEPQLIPSCVAGCFQSALSDEEPKKKETKQERRRRRYNLWMDFLKLNHKFPFP
jgi:hypothetical protein